MTALYDLSTIRPRKVGMTRSEGNRFASLHGNALQAKNKTRAPSPEDINVPPQESSDEASIIAEEDLNIRDAVTFEKRNSGSRSPKNATRGKRDGPEVEKEQDGVPMPPSIMRPSKFTSSAQEGSLDGSQKSRKTGMDITDEDEEDPFGMSQPTKRRKTATGYGSSSQRSAQANIHHGSAQAKKRRPVHRNKSSDGGNGTQSIRILSNVDNTLARGTSRWSYIDGQHADLGCSGQTGSVRRAR